MNQDSPPNNPESSPTPQRAPVPPVKPPRSPAERIIVWSIILVGAGIAAWEARAKFGYDGAREKIEDRAKDDGGADYKALTLAEVKDFVSGGPSYSEPEAFGDHQQKLKLTWPSLFKTYEITLLLTKDKEQIVLGLETAEPPPPKPVAVADGDGEVDHGAGGPPMAGGGGPPPSHDAQNGGEGGGGGPGAGAGGGGRRGPRGLMGLLQADDVKAELGVSEEQSTKISALQEQLQADAPDLRELFGQAREAEGEARAKIQAEIQKALDEMAAKAKEGLGGILDENQMTRLQQIDWQRQGVQALASSDVMTQLAFTDEQTSKMKELNDQFSAARRALGRDASAEDRAKFNEEYEAKFQGVLTDEQTQAWQKMQGEKFERAAATE